MFCVKAPREPRNKKSQHSARAASDCWGNVSVLVGTTARACVPWFQRLSFNIIFSHLEICDAKSWSKRRAGRKRKPLVATVENLPFMLAQHLTAVKDVIFFWPITKGDQIYNLLTGPGGSVLRYSEINYFVGRGEERLPCLQAAKLPGCFVFIPKRDKLLLWHLKWKGKT